MKTSHDISAGIVRLNFNQLFRTVQIAVGLSKAECERRLSEIQHAGIYGKTVSGQPGGDHRQMFSAAKELARHAEQLATATGTLDALEYARTREELVIERDAPIPQVA
jgi:hypothetical protein